VKRTSESLLFEFTDTMSPLVLEKKTVCYLSQAVIGSNIHAYMHTYK